MSRTRVVTRTWHEHERRTCRSDWYTRRSSKEEKEKKKVRAGSFLIGTNARALPANQYDAA